MIGAREYTADERAARGKGAVIAFPWLLCVAAAILAAALVLLLAS